MFILTKIINLFKKNKTKIILFDNIYNKNIISDLNRCYNYFKYDKHFINNTIYNEYFKDLIYQNILIKILKINTLLINSIFIYTVNHLTFYDIDILINYYNNKKIIISVKNCMYKTEDNSVKYNYPKIKFILIR